MDHHRARGPSGGHPGIALPRTQLSRLQLIGLFLLVCAVVAIEAQQNMWNQHLRSDVGEFWLRTERYLTFQLQGTEYPPFAMLYFLFLRWAELTFHLSFEKNFLFANYVLLGLHLALLNHVAGRRAAILFGVLMLAAGSIILFRYELLVSFLTLLAWCAWRYNWSRCAGALLAAAILSKLYPLLLVPLFARPPLGTDVRRQVSAVAIGLGLGVAAILLFFRLGGDPISSFSGVLRFHDNKPVGLESTPAILTMAIDALRGAWPSHSVNEYSIHGLRLPAPYRWLMQLGLLLSLGALLYSGPEARGRSDPDRPGDDRGSDLLDDALPTAVLDLARGLHGSAAADWLGGTPTLSDGGLVRGGLRQRADRLSLPLHGVPGDLLRAPSRRRPDRGASDRQDRGDRPLYPGLPGRPGTRPRLRWSLATIEVEES